MLHSVGVLVAQQTDGAWEHVVYPGSHVMPQPPLLHVGPPTDGHAWVHEPQASGSELTSRHAPLQLVFGKAQDEAHVPPKHT